MWPGSSPDRIRLRPGPTLMGGIVIYSIDPGLKATAWTLMHNDCRLIAFDMVEKALQIKDRLKALPADVDVVIERPVCRRHSGSEVSETAIFTGMLASYADHCRVTFLTRSKIRGVLGATRGGDAKVIKRLVQRFAPGQANHGKGTKKDPGYFYGMKADIWQAYAAGVAFNTMVTRDTKDDREYLKKWRVF